MKNESGSGKLQLLFSFGIYIIFILVFLLFTLSSKHFLTMRNMVNILQQSVAIGIASVGIVFVLLTAGIDISIGSVMYCCAVFAGLFMTRGLHPLLAIAAAMMIGAVFGAINGFIITKWKIVPFITTLAMMGLAKGIGLLASDTQTVFLNTAAKKIATAKALNFTVQMFGDKPQNVFIPVIVIVFFAVMIIGHYVLSCTVFGRQLYAVGNDPRAAAKIGIKTDRIIFIVYVISGGLAGLAGIISGAQVGAITVNFATGNEFLAISAAVLGGVSFFGGKGKMIPGALMGVLLIHVILNGLTMVNASHYAYAIFRSIIIFVAVLVDSVNNKGDIR